MEMSQWEPKVIGEGSMSACAEPLHSCFITKEEVHTWLFPNFYSFVGWNNSKELQQSVASVRDQPLTPLLFPIKEKGTNPSHLTGKDNSVSSLLTSPY